MGLVIESFVSVSQSVSVVCLSYHSN